MKLPGNRTAGIKVFCSLLLLMAGAASAKALMQAEASLFWMTPKGDVAVGYKDVSGTRVDIADDLGYDGSYPIPGAEVVLGDVHQFGLAVNEVSLSEDQRISRTIRFHDKTYSLNTVLESSLDMMLVKGYYRFSPGTSLARGGFVVGVQYVSAEVETKAEGVGSAHGDVKSPMPFIGLYFMSYPLPFMGFQASAAGSKWDLGQISASYVDLEVRAEIELMLGVYAGAGYRYVGVDVEDDDMPAEADVTLSGPVVYVGFEW